MSIVAALKRVFTPTMAPLRAYFPEIAARETRRAIVEHHPSLPAGDYTFDELYCIRRGCDCRNVILFVFDESGRTLATLNHALDPDGFHDIGESRTFLDGINAQTQHAPALLELFKTSVLDDVYSERLERHWRMMKEKVHGGAFPARSGIAVSRTDPIATCAKMDSWPQSWRMVPDDVVAGVALVESFKPFLLWLAGQSISPKTLQRHVDNLWVLGGEIIRRMNQDAAPRKLPDQEAILDCVDETGGPLASGLDEAGQRDLDATCRKLSRFLRARASTAHRTAPQSSA